MSKLQENIQKQMARLGLNAAQLAKKAKVSPPYLWRIIKGERDAEAIGFLKLQALAKALRISISELTGDPAYKDLEHLLAHASELDRKIFECVVDLPEDHHKRKTILDILGIVQEAEQKKASSSKKK